MLQRDTTIKVPVEILDFYRALNELHEEFTDEFPCQELNSDQKECIKNQQAPLLNFLDFSIDSKRAHEAYSKVCRVLRQHRPQLKDSLDKIEKELDAQNNDIRPLLEKVIWQNDDYLVKYCEKLQIDHELLVFVLFNTVKPFVMGFAKSVKEPLTFELWHQNNCPICGGKPALAINKTDGGGKLLQCSMCDTKWEFNYIQCPHCFNEDHKLLKYLNVEDDEVYKVDVCDKCHGYIKTVREGKLISPENAMFTDLKTIHLDILAQREGYTKNVEISPKSNIN